MVIGIVLTRFTPPLLISSDAHIHKFFQVSLHGTDLILSHLITRHTNNDLASTLFFLWEQLASMQLLALFVRFTSCQIQVKMHSYVPNRYVGIFFPSWDDKIRFTT